VGFTTIKNITSNHKDRFYHNTLFLINYHFQNNYLNLINLIYIYTLDDGVKLYTLPITKLKIYMMEYYFLQVLLSQQRQLELMNSAEGNNLAIPRERKEKIGKKRGKVVKLEKKI